MSKRMGLILFGCSDFPVMAYKDCGMFLYELSELYGWKTQYLYFKTQSVDTTWSQLFVKNVEPICIGNTSNYREQITLAKRYIIEHALEFDIMMFFNYGSTIWKLAKLCKKINPSIIVYSKLDMGIGGFSHFCNNKMGISIKNWFEKIKSRYVDFFTVETKSYFEELEKTSVFSNRIGYLPNGVSLLDVDLKAVEANTKENLVITVGRLGDYAKNTELLVDAIKIMPKDIKKQWKFYFIGPSTNAFRDYVDEFKKTHIELSKQIIMTGEIRDRTKLYSLCRKAKIICMPSRNEGACIATIEAMYFGAYPIITEYSAFALDTTNQKKLGTIVLPTAEDVAASLINTMENQKLPELNLQCQKYARSQFDYVVLAKKLNGYLSKIQ